MIVSRVRTIDHGEASASTDRHMTGAASIVVEYFAEGERQGGYSRGKLLCTVVQYLLHGSVQR